jgi:hypothetical protein
MWNHNRCSFKRQSFYLSTTGDEATYLINTTIYIYFELLTRLYFQRYATPRVFFFWLHLQKFQAWIGEKYSIRIEYIPKLTGDNTFPSTTLGLQFYHYDCSNCQEGRNSEFLTSRLSFRIPTSRLISPTPPVLRPRPAPPRPRPPLPNTPFLFQKPSPVPFDRRRNGSLPRPPAWRRRR